MKAVPTTVFDESLQEWTRRTGGTATEWRQRTLAMWDRLKASSHWHNGQTCREASCPNGTKQVTSQAAS